MTLNRFIVFIFGCFLIVLAGCASNKPVLAEPTIRFPTLTTSINRDTSNTLTLRNTGESDLTYSVTASNTLVSVQNASGTISPKNSGGIQLSASCSDEPGTGTTTLNVTSNGGNKSIDVKLECFEPFNIDVRFIGSDFSESRQAVFAEAADQWSSIIVRDLEDLVIKDGTLPATTQLCGFATPEITLNTIDDLLIFASIAPIDGEGNILGQAGPSVIRISDELTVIGCMQFDVADVENLEAEGTFNQTILHEMGHVLGYGSLWEPIPQFNSRNLLDKSCQGTPGATSGFEGSNAILEFGVLGKSGNPPVENNFGRGTRCSHWDEGLFDNELMTGFLGGKTSATVNPLSALSIASMKDLGYTVDFSQSDGYTLPACLPNCDQKTSLNAQSVKEPWEIVLKPKGTIDANGELTWFNNR